MTTRDERFNAKANRDDHDTAARNLGHALTWKLAPNATRAGHAYYYIGTCANCAGVVHVGASWSSTPSLVVDPRHDRCGGPGTSVLTEIEQGRVHELVAPAVADFGAAVRTAIARMN